MEPTALDIVRTGDLGGRKVAMKFDENSLAHIMSVLTDLYSDPALAVIREYSTNAADSHIAAGQTRPIEVTTPSNMSPFFKVRDFGTGLSIDDIADIYSKYGASTKRGTNEQVGMLGLGCKSALTFAPQFTLVSSKNGVKATVSISRVEDGTGVMEIVDTCATNEPNGVEVVIPARHTHEFASKVENFFRFWTPGSVLVNGQEPEFIQGNKVGDNFLMVSGTRQDYVVMGNVAYPVKPDTLYNRSGRYNNYGVVAFVPIGSINFTPSREALHYTAHTNATLAKAREEFTSNLVKAITDDIAKAETHVAALSKYISWEQMLGSGGLPQGITYQGENIPTRFTFGADENGRARNGLIYFANRTRYSVDHIGQLNYGQVSAVTVIYNYTAEKVSTDHRAKAREYAGMKGIANNQFLFVEEPFGQPWISGQIDWNDIRRATRKAGGRKASAGLRFSVLTDASDYFTETDEIDDDKTIVYYSPADHKYCPFSKIVNEDTVVVSLGKNRWDKFLRDFPDAIPVEKHLRNLEAAAVKALSESDKIALGIDYYEKNILNRFDASKIDDPEVVRFINLAKAANKTPAIAEWERVSTLLREFSLYTQAVAIDSNPLERYPLIRGNSVQPHTYLYMNAAYAAEKENN